MTGIYKITNKLNGKSYIGKASDLELRKEQHFEALQYSNKSWYPEAREESNSIDDFTFEVLQYCEEKELDAIEEYWIKKFDTYNNGYNKTEDGQFKPVNLYKIEILNSFLFNQNFCKELLLKLTQYKLTYSEKIFYLYLIFTYDENNINYLQESNVKEYLGISHDTYISIRKKLSQLKLIEIDKQQKILFVNISI